MKKNSKKLDLVKLISGGVSLLGFILLIISAFVTGTAKSTLGVLGYVMFLGGGLVSTFRSQEHTLAKMLGFLVIAGIALTWVLPYGYFRNVDFYDMGLLRVGLLDIGLIFHSILNWNFEKVTFLIVVAAFYGIVCQTSGYKKLINTLAKKLKKQPLIVAIIISLVITGLTSIFTDSFAMFIILPFFISLLLGMGIDKLTTFAITFGSMLIGSIGCTYGTSSLLFFNEELGVDVNFAIEYRLIILLVAFFLFNFFIFMRLKKVLKEKNNENLEKVAFVVEETKEKASMIPALIIMVIIFLITILGFIDWKTNFGIEAFEKLNTTIYSAKIGDTPIMEYILSQTTYNTYGQPVTQAVPFGEFLPRTMEVILVIGSLLMALIYRLKINTILASAYNGIKKMIKPILYYCCAAGAFMIVAKSPFTFTITNWVLNAVDGFNPLITTIATIITSIFHLDFGFAAYGVGSFLSSAYVNDFNVAHTLYIAISNLVHVIAPTSIIMIIGLALMDVDYKTWFKYIWLFVLGMLVILLVLFTVL